MLSPPMNRLYFVPRSHTLCEVCNKYPKEGGDKKWASWTIRNSSHEVGAPAKEMV